MRIPRIYTDSALTEGGTAALDDNAAQHVGRVLRMQPGQELLLFNGDGNDYPATISSASKKNVEVQVGTPEANTTESPLEIVLGQTLSKGDRMDYAVQKAASPPRKSPRRKKKVSCRWPSAPGYCERKPPQLRPWRFANGFGVT